MYGMHACVCVCVHHGGVYVCMHACVSCLFEMRGWCMSGRDGATRLARSPSENTHTNHATGARPPALRYHHRHRRRRGINQSNRGGNEGQQKTTIHALPSLDRIDHTDPYNPSHPPTHTLSLRRMTRRRAGGGSGGPRCCRRRWASSSPTARRRGRSCGS